MLFVIRKHLVFLKLVNRDLYAKTIKNNLYQRKLFRKNLERKTYVSNVLRRPVFPLVYLDKVRPQIMENL